MPIAAMGPLRVLTGAPGFYARHIHKIFRFYGLRGFCASLVLLAFALPGASAQVLPRSPVVPLPGHVPVQLSEGVAKLLGPYSKERRLRLAITLKPPHPVEEKRFLGDLTDRNSINFHRFLTAVEWNTRFAPATGDEQQVVAWAESQGMTVTHRYPNRLLVDLEAPAGVIEQAFGVRINSYQVGDEVDFSNDGDPVIPARLASIVQSVLGLNNIQRMHSAAHGSRPLRPSDYSPGPVVAAGGVLKNDATLAPAAPHSPAPLFSGLHIEPVDLYSSQTYNFNGLWRLGHCCNPANLSAGSPPESSIAIATFGNFNPADLTAFFQTYGLASNITWYYIDGTPPGPDEETTLDTEWATAMANSYGALTQTAQVYVYMAAAQTANVHADMYNTMLSDGHARVFSTSWTCAEDGGCSAGSIATYHAIFDSMVGQGWTLVSSSGDGGATVDCYFQNPAHTSVGYPGSDPDVVSVGGTSLYLDFSANWSSEPAWQGATYAGACAHNNGGSGGGLSSIFGRPAYQSHWNVPGRMVPDIALNAGGDYQVVYFNGDFTSAGGTSIAAPEVAAFFAQENAYLLSIPNICGAGNNARCAPLGQPHAFLYGEGLTNSATHSPFYDTTSGCNSNDQTQTNNLAYYCAEPGYDQVTGWGSANMLQLAWALNFQILGPHANGSPYISSSGPFENFWYNTDQTFYFSVYDYAGDKGPNGTGIAGFTAGWDSIPSDSRSMPNPGAGDAFYDGPQYPNATRGCLSFLPDNPQGCLGGIAEGCHYAYVRAWNNEGLTSDPVAGIPQAFGPFCYDISPPVTTANISMGPTEPLAAKRTFTVALDASDQYSGVANTYYRVSGGLPPTGGYSVYRGPFKVTVRGPAQVYFYSADNAGNLEQLHVRRF
jgi:kumamolisin